MVTLTWTSLNIDSYKASVHSGLGTLRAAVSTVNDILEHRIEKNIRLVSKLAMVTLPDNLSFSLEDFVSLQEQHIRAQTEVQRFAPMSFREAHARLRLCVSVVSGMRRYWLSVSICFSVFSVPPDAVVYNSVHLET